ncbi:MAG: type II toxin-antitoxin system RelE/ParE family toxin [Nanoarchaeota archaeon]|nr:type II toxin-antitoxin system RelE/ParE family toxin [Nanoarchaeota archaeon]
MGGLRIMFEFSSTSVFDKKFKLMLKKDKVLANATKNKIKEIVSQNTQTIDIYKNLKKPLQDMKRIHITGQYILLFKVYKENNMILIVDILHRDVAYK